MADGAGVSGAKSAKRHGGRTTTPKGKRMADGSRMLNGGIPFPALRDGTLYRPEIAVAWPGWTGTVSWVTWTCAQRCTLDSADSTAKGKGLCKPHGEPYRWYAVVDWGMRLFPDMPASRLRLDSLDPAEADDA